MTRRLVIPSGGAQVATEQAGQGPVLMFLHSGVTDRRGWSAQLQGFQGAYRVLAYDRRGFGDTQPVSESYSNVQDLLAVLDSVQTLETVLIGNSQGGLIALDFTLAYPERVRALVLIASAIRGAPKVEHWPDDVQKIIDEIDRAEAAGDLDAVNELEAQLWLDGPGSPQGRVGGPVRDLFLDMNGQALRAEGMGSERPTLPAYDRLQQIRVPTLVVVGDLDLPHIQAQANDLAQTLPNARLSVMPGTAHLPQFEQPESFNALLDTFLGTLPAP